MFLPTECDIKGCMINDGANYPTLCTNCVMLAIENLNSLPQEEKEELFFKYKDTLSTGMFEAFIDEACRLGNMTKEEYLDAEEHMWNHILMGDE